MTAAAVHRQVEERTRRLGRELLERMREDRASIFELRWWEERLLRKFMRDEWLKVRAFRLVDVLPALQSRREVARHLREYFAESDGAAAHPDHAWVPALLRFEDLDGPRAGLLAWAAWQGATRMAQRFIAGATVAEAERVVRRLREQGMAFTLDVLGEAALSDRESLNYQRLYLDLLTELPRRSARWPATRIDEAGEASVPRVNVSVKLSALLSRFDAIAPEATARLAQERLRPLLRQAVDAGAHLHVDMEHYAFKDLTLHICRELFLEDEFRAYPHFGIVLQAYLRDCERDAAETIEWARRRGAPVWVRLVKGAYWDAESVLADRAGWPRPVWDRKWESDACYERCTRMLLEAHRFVHTAFGSHNVRSLAHAMALRDALAVPPHAFELQMLYGMGDPLKRAAVAMRERCRVYTPCGELLVGMAYFIRRLLENTANDSFLRQSSDESVPIESLLEDPLSLGRAAAPLPAPPAFRHEFDELIMDPFTNVPNTDFTREENRRRMLAGLGRAEKRLGADVALRIGGERFSTDEWQETFNPSRPDERVARVALADAVAVERAVEAASEAFARWSRTPPLDRAELLHAAAREIEERRFDLAGLLVFECGMPWREADAEVSRAIDFCEYSAREMRRLVENPRRRDVPGESNEYYYVARGVTAAVTPWNSPLATPACVASAALVAGNTVIVAPAPAGSASTEALLRVFEEAGAPPGVINLLPGSEWVLGEALARHAGIATIAFTGTRAAGLHVLRLAAEHPTSPPGLKRMILDTGGRGAILIDSDADLDDAIRGVLASAFGFAGQGRSSASRCIVVEGAHERFVERLVEATRSLSVGPADEPTTSIPPLIDAAAAEAFRRVVATGREECRCALEVDVREHVARSGGHFAGPAVFVDVPPEAQVLRTETLGPVLAVLAARDFEEALALFNAGESALVGGLYSRSPSRIAAARAACQCGNLFINRRITGPQADLQPFGGYRMSGNGARAGGPDYLVQFCEARCVTENTMRGGFAPGEPRAREGSTPPAPAPS